MQRITVVGIILAASVVSLLAQAERPEAPMQRAASALIAAVDDAQRAKLVWVFDSEERFNWHFIPREREGLPLKAMNAAQRDAAFALLRTGLSASGFKKVEAVRSLEAVLFAMSGSATRDEEQYFFTIFGDPTGATWGWRYEGHHLAQNWTIESGRAVSTTPAFFGANPAQVMEGPRKGFRALPGEADLAWALLEALPEAQRRAALIEDSAPRDIVTGNARKAAIIDNRGLSLSALSAAHRSLLMALVEEHASSQSAALAAGRLAGVRSASPDQVRFAWMGATDRAAGQGHYYRIQGPTFLIEYDNVQNGANHQHVVWRDFEGDFGVDLLGAHYASDPVHAGKAVSTGVFHRFPR